MYDVAKQEWDDGEPVPPSLLVSMRWVAVGQMPVDENGRVTALGSALTVQFRDDPASFVKELQKQEYAWSLSVGKARTVDASGREVSGGLFTNPPLRGETCPLCKRLVPVEDLTSERILELIGAKIEKLEGV